MSGPRTLTDYPLTKVRLICRHCERTAQYDRAALIEYVGVDVPLPQLLLQMGERLGCDLARRNLAQPADSTAGIERCALFFPDLMTLWREQR
jgi:hypothetical protein